MNFGEWYQENQALNKKDFEEKLSVYKNNILDQLEKSLENKDSIYIVNAGRMNHGKSSLFNSLLEREEFKAKDVRTTVKNKEVTWKDNIIFIDTPGLDAVDADTEEAYKAYYKADLIFFVHTVRTGELHESEINAIKKIAKNFSKDYFWKHFCFILSFKESVDTESLAAIKTESVEAIKRACTADDFAVFAISNSRYLKGIKENKASLINHSGILELKNYIDEQVAGWQHDIIKKKKIMAEEKLKAASGEIKAFLAVQLSSGSENWEEVRDVVKQYKVEIDKIYEKMDKNTKKGFELIHQTMDLNHKYLDLGSYFDDETERRRRNIEREIERLEAENDKLTKANELLEDEADDKEAEARIACIKLGILDEEDAFNYNLVMENIDELTKKTGQDDVKLKLIQNLGDDFESFSQADNILTLLGNGQVGKYLQEIVSVAEWLDDEEINKDKDELLALFAKTKLNKKEELHLEKKLNTIYTKLHQCAETLRKDLTITKKSIDDIVNGYRAEAESRRREIKALKAKEADREFDEKVSKIREAIDRELDAMERNPDNISRYQLNIDRLNEKWDQMRDEVKRLYTIQGEMLDNATAYFRKCGVLNEAERYYTDTIDGFIDRIEDRMYAEQIGNKQDELKRLDESVKAVTLAADFAGIHVN